MGHKANHMGQNKCIFCKEYKDSVTLAYDPYDYEMSDTNERKSLKKIFICKQCSRERAEEV